MVANEVFVNYYNFNPIWLQHASIHVEKYWYSRQKKVIVKVTYKIYSEPGLKPEPELEPEAQFGFAAPRSRSRKKYFRLSNTGYRQSGQSCGSGAASFCRSTWISLIRIQVKSPSCVFLHIKTILYQIMYFYLDKWIKDVFSKFNLMAGSISGSTLTRNDRTVHLTVYSFK